ncbi:MAG TPA: hypothetical protein PL074_07035 [Thermoflexales bacterium]|nr:hypothetical protein [Thermoflexales bacterium]HQX76049.1 hypothetical protein [Thermoflexales bacterium]
MSGILTRNQILASSVIKRERVNVPAWGGDVWIRELTIAERDRYKVHMMRVDENGKITPALDRIAEIRVMLVEMAACDDEGQSLFQPGDVAKLGGDSDEAVEQLSTVAMRLSGLENTEPGKG